MPLTPRAATTHAAGAAPAAPGSLLRCMRSRDATTTSWPGAGCVGKLSRDGGWWVRNLPVCCSGGGGGTARCPLPFTASASQGRWRRQADRGAIRYWHVLCRIECCCAAAGTPGLGKHGLVRPRTMPAWPCTTALSLQTGALHSAAVLHPCPPTCPFRRSPSGKLEGTWLRCNAWLPMRRGSIHAQTCACMHHPAQLRTFTNR